MTSPRLHSKMNLIVIKLPDFEFIHRADGSRVDDYCQAIDRQWVTRGQPPSHHPPSPTHTLGNWRWKSIIDVANGSHARPLESTSIFGYCHSRWTLFGEKKNGSMDTSFSCDESILNFFFFFLRAPRWIFHLKSWPSGGRSMNWFNNALSDRRFVQASSLPS